MVTDTLDVPAAFVVSAAASAAATGSVGAAAPGFALAVPPVAPPQPATSAMALTATTPIFMRFHIPAIGSPSFGFSAKDRVQSHRVGRQWRRSHAGGDMLRPGERER